MWPESEERHARADLRAVLHKLRKTLKEEGAHDGVARFFVIESNRLELEPREIELDLEVFEAAVSLARRETSLGGRAPLLEGAGSSSAGCKVIWDSTGVMEGFSLENAPEFELWLEGERARWRRVFGRAMREALSPRRGGGSIAEAIGTARLWVRQAPLEETAHRRLMELLSGAGESERPCWSTRAEHPKQSAWDGALYADAAAGRSVAEEVEERASLGASQYTLQLLLRFRCWRCRWLAARKSLVRSSQSIKRRAWAKRASCPSWGRRG